MEEIPLITCYLWNPNEKLYILHINWLAPFLPSTVFWASIHHPSKWNYWIASSFIGCVAPSQNSSGKWRFSSGFPTEHVIILLVTGILGGGHIQVIHLRHDLYRFSCQRRHLSSNGIHHLWQQDGCGGVTCKSLTKNMCVFSRKWRILGGWTIPLKNMRNVKLDHFTPKNRGEYKKHIWNVHVHLGLVGEKFGMFFLGHQWYIFISGSIILGP